MKILLDIKESKIAFVLELLDSFNFVKVRKLSKEKSSQIQNIAEAVEELNLIKEGKMEGIPARDLLNDL